MTYHRRRWIILAVLIVSLFSIVLFSIVLDMMPGLRSAAKRAQAERQARRGRVAVLAEDSPR